jgi:ribosomal protein S18 acetylase RimI-like enzyme
MDIESRPATEDDIPYLMGLRRATMDAHLAASGVTPGDVYHEERLRYRFDCARVLLEDGRPVGLLKVARDADPWEIIQVQLDPALQGRGMGRRLLEQVIAQADAADVGLCLSVLLHNPARHLYERLGFTVTGIEDAEYRMERRRAP